MKKEFRYCSSIIALGTLMFFSSCSNSTTTEEKVKTDSLPRNPVQGQVYRDNNGHSWIYDYAMMRWIMGSGGTGGNTYYYYPSTGTYQDNSGKTIVPPSTISSGISDGIKARTEPVIKTRTVTTSPTKSPTTSKTRAVFGGTGKGHSISS